MVASYLGDALGALATFRTVTTGSRSTAGVVFGQDAVLGTS